MNDSQGSINVGEKDLAAPDSPKRSHKKKTGSSKDKEKSSSKDKEKSVSDEKAKSKDHESSKLSPDEEKIVQLVAHDRHRKAAHDLSIVIRLRIDIDGRQVIGFLYARPCIDGDRVEQLLSRSLHGLLRARVTWSTACSVHGDPPPLIPLELSYIEKSIIVQ